MKSRYFRRIVLGLFSLIGATSLAQSLSPSTKWHWDEGTIVVETPERPSDQQTALGLTTPVLSNVRVAFVGLGMRGPDAVARWSHIPGIEVIALCDYEEERAVACQKILREAGLPPASVYSGEQGYEAICLRNDIDIVYIATDWDHHFPIAKLAMENGKHVAVEVPSAMNLEQCWTLIALSEQKRLHCFILENCCYDWFEMNALNMAQHGVFGEIIRAQGAYIHNLDPFWDYYWKSGSDDKLGWRMRYNMENRGDLYATHGLGPVAQALDIHRGDRMKLLVAMDTKAVHGPEWVEQKTGQRPATYRSGDATTTLVRTENGKVIEIQHNVMSPQPYNRLYQLTGTKGFANKYPIEGYALSSEQLKAAGTQPSVDDLSGHAFIPKAEAQALEKKYYSPILARYGKDAKEIGGHGGMDYVMDSRLVYCLQNGLRLDMDVYDLAEWCCIGELGALSMDHNCASVTFPDFTRGHWNDVKGYRHAFAQPEAEALSLERATRVTAVQKELAHKAWTEYDKALDTEARNLISVKYVKLVQKRLGKK